MRVAAMRDDEIRFAGVAVGDVFVFNGVYVYMRVLEAAGYNAVSLRNGYLVCIAADEQVRLLPDAVLLPEGWEGDE